MMGGTLLIHRRQITSLEQEKKQLAMSPEMAHLSAARRHATRSGRRLVRKLDKQDEAESCIRAERDLVYFSFLGNNFQFT
jgi:hypothetical protein